MAVKASLESNRPQTGVKPSNTTLLEHLDLILTKNNFQFNGHHCIQIKDISMCSRVLTNLAIFLMGDFDLYTLITYNH